MKTFLKISFYIAISLLLVFTKVEASEAERIKCIDNLRLAFKLQSQSKNYGDSYNNCVLFNSAEAQLEKMGKPKHRLEATRNL